MAANDWRIVDNPPFTEDLRTDSKKAAWEALKRQVAPGTRLTGPVYAQAPFGVFYDAGLGFPVLLEVVEFDPQVRLRQFPGDYPPLGSTVSAELADFLEHNRQLRVIRYYKPAPVQPHKFPACPSPAKP